MARPQGTKTWIEVSRGALRANAAALKRSAPNSRLICVVKSNAYGHGTAETVRALRGRADWFAVDSLAEAQAVRSAAAAEPVLILGYTLHENLKAAVRSGFRLTVYNPETARQLAVLATARHPAHVHLKIETGTSRQGILEDDLPALLRILRRNPHVIVEGASTHFANIEDTTDSSYARGQLRRYLKAVAVIESSGRPVAVKHTACSAAAILFPETHFDAVRTGIALYGLWPSAETKVSARSSGRSLELRTALVWKTLVAQVKALPAGTPVSYGLTEKLTRRSNVAVMPIGYWDGLDRGLSSVGHVLIRGRRAKILGRVCMNMCVVDVTEIPGVRPEDEAIIIGPQKEERIAEEEVARQLGTINYEVVTRINPTLPRVLVA